MTIHRTSYRTLCLGLLSLMLLSGWSCWRRGNEAPKVTEEQAGEVKVQQRTIVREGVVLPKPELQYQGLTYEEKDSDGDGLSDTREQEAGTDPTHPDTDRDGIPDGTEVLFFKTDPKNADTDGDGFTDAEEIQKGYNPKEATPGRLTSPPGSVQVMR